MAARQTARGTAGSIGLAVGVVTTWAFTVSTGITVPVEVAAAWGAIMTTVCGWAVSRLGA